jgi:2-dehydro-3-deoxyphosphogluconate aldolase / (4S)-4-hydroxy-2-oxoglutarate aldolase
MTRSDDTLSALETARFVAVIRSDDAPSSIRTAEALIAGGMRAIELTFTTPDVADAARQLIERHPQTTIGLGTITTVQQASLAAETGAAFVVSPGSPPELLSAMLETGVTTLAGCLTPTEILLAHQRGAHAIKIFPASAVGPDYLRAIHGPLPGLKLIPTGGITPETADGWLAAGAFAVGLGGKLSASVRSGSERQALADAARALLERAPA